MRLSYMKVAGGDPCEAEFSKAGLSSIAVSFAFKQGALAPRIRRGRTYWLFRYPPLQIDLQQ
jgi:hypothetical protein